MITYALIHIYRKQVISMEKVSFMYPLNYNFRTLSTVAEIPLRCSSAENAIIIASVCVAGTSANVKVRYDRFTRTRSNEGHAV